MRCGAIGRGGERGLGGRLQGSGSGRGESLVGTKRVGGAVVRVVVKITAVGARATCRLRGRRGRGLAVRVGGRGCRC